MLFPTRDAGVRRGPPSPHFMTVAQALATQGRVIHALMLREIKTRFGKLKLGYLWAFFEPVMFVLILGLIFTVLGSDPPGGLPLPLFLATGIMTFIFFRSGLTFTMMALRMNRALLTFPQVTPFELVIARAALEFATMLIVFVSLFAVYAFATNESIPVQDPLGVFFGLGVVYLIGFGTGVSVSALVLVFPSIQELVGAFIIRPGFLLSGIFFSADMIPEEFQRWALLNPVLHAVEMVRSAFFWEFDSDLAVPAYPVGFALVVVFLGFVVLRAFRARIYQP